MGDYPTLKLIAEALRQELHERYPDCYLMITELQAPGYALVPTHMPNTHTLMVKVINDRVLVDREGIITRDHNRLLEVDITDPTMMEKVVIILDTEWVCRDGVGCER